MRWVTFENVGIDRMACAWLIRRWIDADAEFLFVPRGAGALPPDAEPFARIVDEADTVQEIALEPAAAGVDLICRGIRLTSPSDQVALERGAMLYEALYAQLKADAEAV